MKIPTRIIDGDLSFVALHALECNLSWEPSARLIGNCRAEDLATVFEEYLEFKKIRFQKTP